MKKLRFILGLFLLAVLNGAAFAQRATVTATITSAWAGGSVVANFVPQGGGKPSPLQTSGIINSSGAFSLNSAWNNLYSGYVPSVTTFNICVGSAPATCYSTTVQITSSSQDISSAFSGAPTPSGGSVTAAAIQAALTPLTGCNTSLLLYSPATNTCIAGSAPQTVAFKRSAFCIAGAANPADLTLPVANAPAVGCVDPTVNAFGYYDFAAAAVSPQYAYGDDLLPANWLGDDLTITFYTAQTSGNATFSVQTACIAQNVAATPFTYGSAVTVTTAASATTNGVLTTASFANIAVNGTNSCAPGALLHYQITRSASDTVAGDVFVLGATLTTRRSS